MMRRWRRRRLRDAATRNENTWESTHFCRRERSRSDGVVNGGRPRKTKREPLSALAVKKRLLPMQTFLLTPLLAFVSAADSIPSALARFQENTACRVGSGR
jgi:hypothetical protein